MASFRSLLTQHADAPHSDARPDDRLGLRTVVLVMGFVTVLTLVLGAAGWFLG